MNKTIKQLVPIVFLLAFIVFFVITWVVCGSQYDRFSEESTKTANNEKTRESYQQQVKRIEDVQENEKMRLKSLKPIYETDREPMVGEKHLGIFGNMFETIVSKIHANGLMAYSIEYDMSPETDPIYSEYPTDYNVCELKVTLVGTYPQVQSFLNDITKNFEYLVYISGLDIAAFTSNTDYLVSTVAITLYSKKLSQKRKKLGST